jgi:hypothetical protein
MKWSLTTAIFRSDAEYEKTTQNALLALQGYRFDIGKIA